VTTKRTSDWIRGNLLGLVAIFIALSGTAYATHPGGADTISSADIIDAEVRSPDLAPNSVGSGKIVDETVRSADIGTNQVTTGEIATNAVRSGDIAANHVLTSHLATGAVESIDVLNGSLTGTDVANNSLKGADIDESTLTNIGGGGPAGGDLTGTYPDPEIAPDAVGAAELAPRAVGSNELFGNVTIVSDSEPIPPSGGVGRLSVNCPPDGVILGGGAAFEFPSGDISGTEPFFQGWIAEGQNNGNAEQRLSVAAVCLLPASG
jgi:hypothetical protein